MGRGTGEFVQVGKVGVSSLSCKIAVTEKMTCSHRAQNKAFWLQIEVALSKEERREGERNIFINSFQFFNILENKTVSKKTLHV